MAGQSEKAEAFRALHKGKILVLPNGWDVPSARVFEDAGFPAVATSSAGLMVSLGFQDGEEIGIDILAKAVGKIANALSVPLSADVVGGFGRTPEEASASVLKIVEAGAVGVNVEDFVTARRSFSRSNSRWRS
ncbi:MAG: isocitrate lyase/phosphoenolpyruvate mutase family protein [archaeon]|nr:MAG: isocitrate lyase/phosphoenolpyruvate mutase family protein [archaeon]